MTLLARHHTAGTEAVVVRRLFEDSLIQDQGQQKETAIGESSHSRHMAASQGKGKRNATGSMFSRFIEARALFQERVVAI